MKKFRITALGMIAGTGLVLAGSAVADPGDVIEERLDERGDRIEERLDRRGDRIDERLDRRGDRVDERLDRRGERINDRLDEASDRASDAGRDGRNASISDNTGGCRSPARQGTQGL